MTELLRFYEDLGIIANRGTEMEHNENLIQGQAFMEHRRYNKRHIRMDRIEEGFSTLFENMDNANEPVNIFKDIDTNKDGSISRNEMDAWFMMKYKTPTPQSVYDMNDLNKDGIVSWSEFKGPKGNPPQVQAQTQQTQQTQAQQTPEQKKAQAEAEAQKVAEAAAEKKAKKIAEENAKVKAKMLADKPAATASAATATAATAYAAAPAPAPSQTSSKNQSKSLVSSSVEDSEINLDATTFQPVNGDSKTIEGRRDHSILETRSNKYHYIAWLFFAIFIVWAIFNISTFSLVGINIGSELQPAQNNTNVFSMIVIIILIVIAILIFRQFNSNQIKTTISIYDNGAKNDNDVKNNNGAKK